MCDDLIHQGLVSDSGVSRRAFGVLPYPLGTNALGMSRAFSANL